MADIRDEHGNPIQLTDELGRPVELTDEHGVPVHLTGVATAVGSGQHLETTQTTTGSEMHGGTHFAHTPTDYAKRGAEAVVGAGEASVGAVKGVGKAATHAVTGGGEAPASHTHAAGVEGEKKELERSTSSSSSSSEDDGQGGRRKKKGLMAKIKDKLPGHKDKDKDKEETNQEHHQQQQQAAHSFTTKISSTTEPGQPHQPENIRVEHHEQEHQKKGGFIDKIKEKLPGHHS